MNPPAANVESAALVPPQPKNATDGDNRCKVCKSRIEQGATKCTKCSSYQDWRRYFGANQVVLSLLVALTSILTVAVPVVKRAVTGQRAEMHLRRISCRSDVVEVFAFNGGNTPAVLDSAEMRVHAEHDTTTFTLDNSRGNDVFPSNNGRMIALPVKLDGAEASLPTVPKAACAYEMQFKFVDYHHDQPMITLCCESVSR